MAPPRSSPVPPFLRVDPIPPYTPRFLKIYDYDNVNCTVIVISTGTG